MKNMFELATNYGKVTTALDPENATFLSTGYQSNYNSLSKLFTVLRSKRNVFNYTATQEEGDFYRFVVDNAHPFSDYNQIETENHRFHIQQVIDENTFIAEKMTNGEFAELTGELWSGRFPYEVVTGSNYIDILLDDELSMRIQGSYVYMVTPFNIVQLRSISFYNHYVMAFNNHSFLHTTVTVNGYVFGYDGLNKRFFHNSAFYDKDFIQTSFYNNNQPSSYSANNSMTLLPRMPLLSSSTNFRNLGYHPIFLCSVGITNNGVHFDYNGKHYLKTYNNWTHHTIPVGVDLNER